jgi:hypothetical protein
VRGRRVPCLGRRAIRKRAGRRRVVQAGDGDDPGGAGDGVFEARARAPAEAAGGEGVLQRALGDAHGGSPKDVAVCRPRVNEGQVPDLCGDRGRGQPTRCGDTANGRTSKQAHARATIPIVTGRLVERSTTRKDARRGAESPGATLTRDFERSNNRRS